MKAYEFPAKLTPEGKLEPPSEFLAFLPVNQTVKVILLVDESTDAADKKDAWTTLTAEQFASGYSDADSVYDNI
jgi:hypothetical protein